MALKDMQVSTTTIAKTVATKTLTNIVVVTATAGQFTSTCPASVCEPVGAFPDPQAKFVEGNVPNESQLLAVNS